MKWRRVPQLKSLKFNLLHYNHSTIQKYLSTNNLFRTTICPMRHIITKSHPYMYRVSLLTQPSVMSFSTIPPNIVVQKGVQFQFKFRSILKLSELNEYIQQNKEQIKLYGKTVLLEFLNEYPMQSFRRSRDELNSNKRQERYRLRYDIYMFLKEFENLNLYEMNLRYAIFKKLITYVGQEPVIIAEAERNEKQLLEAFSKGNVHISDIINWLYMLPLNYPPHFIEIAFNVLDKSFADEKIRQNYKKQRSLPVLVKRCYEAEWQILRKYKNIIYFLTYEAEVRMNDSNEELIIQLERLAEMKLYLVGEKVIPKLLDQLMGKFEKEFQTYTSNKQLMLKVFSTFKHLPLNYNVPFFNKIHNFLKSTKQLPSHLLLYLPYNKLTESQVAFLQTKMFSVGREDIAMKLIYTIYEPEYKYILTPFIIKQAWTNMTQMWKKENTRLLSWYQTYIALTFRFSKMNNNPIIDQGKLKQIFIKFMTKIQEERFDSMRELSLVGMIAIFELCHHYDIRINENYAATKFETILVSRKERNNFTMIASQMLNALKVHYNAKNKKSRYFLTQFIHEIVNHPESVYSQKLELLFLIQKTMRPEPKWQIYSKILSDEIIKDAGAFVQLYIKYDFKTLKLTNFIFTKLYERKVPFSTVIELLSSLNIKLITSLKGKIITPLKKYIKELNVTSFEELDTVNVSSLVQAYKLLFYFKDEFPEVMEWMSLKLIKIIENRLKQGEYVNGKKFSSLVTYIMETLQNTPIKQKTSTIESIISIMKTLRKKEGIYLKVYELDFLCSNQRYVKINNEVLELHWSQILQTLKKTDRHDHHKDLYIICIKLHCLEFVQLNSFDLRLFVGRCNELIDNGAISLSMMKEALGYNWMQVDDTFILQKMKLFLFPMVKLAFRKDKRKHSYFLHQYFLKFFSRLSSNEMVTEICEKLLYEKLYPIEVSAIVPLLSKNQIKNRKFTKRILDLMGLAESYVTFEKMQVLSWLEKIMYEIDGNNSVLNKMRAKSNEQISQKVKKLKESMKDTLIEEDRSVEDGYEIQDPNFDKNYKLFIEYAWSSLKNKGVSTFEFKFICRYLFFSIQKIKARLQNPEERKQLSKIKLYHVLKYIKEAGFFQINEKKLDEAVREKNWVHEKMRKLRVLKKLEKDLSVMKLQTNENLEKALANLQDRLEWNAKHYFELSKGYMSPVEYYVEEKKSKLKYVIHTVKTYHITKEAESISNKPQSQIKTPKKSIQSPLEQLSKAESASTNLELEQVDILDEGFNQKDPEEVQILMELEEAQGEEFVSIEESELSLEMKPENDVFWAASKQKSNKDVKEPKETKTGKPLFSSMKSKHKEQQPQEKQHVQKFTPLIPLEPYSQSLYKDYNGYLKVEKSLIQLGTGLKCVIYDGEKNIFFA